MALVPEYGVLAALVSAFLRVDRIIQLLKKPEKSVDLWVKTILFRYFSVLFRVVLVGKKHQKSTEKYRKSTEKVPKST